MLLLLLLVVLLVLATMRTRVIMVVQPLPPGSCHEKDWQGWLHHWQHAIEIGGSRGGGDMQQ
jgi:hypothetical protein